MTWTDEHAQEATAALADQWGGWLLADGLPAAARRLEAIADDVREGRDRTTTNDPVAMTLFESLIIVGNAADRPENDKILDGLLDLLRHLDGGAE